MKSRLKSQTLGLMIALGIAMSLLGTAQAFAEDRFAAIVFNPTTGAWGSFQGAYTRQDAELNAMAQCGADCAGVDVTALESKQSPLRETWVRNGWTAYAAGTGAWGTAGIHDSEADAESAAIANCGGAAKNCALVRSLSAYDGG